jgi:hypothetical protein
VAKYHRDQRYKILPAYALDGVVLSRVSKAPPTRLSSKILKRSYFIIIGDGWSQKSVLVMDNACFHHSEKLEQICAEAGVKLVYLAPYSYDLNPVEELFSELKAFIRRHWQVYEDNPNQSFGSFLGWCIETVGARKQSAKGHFQNASLTVEEML